MGKGGKAQTIGYKYHLGMHLGLCAGPIDKITRLQVDGREAWTGTSTGGSIAVSKPELFGGEKREGGVSGTIDVAMGDPAQGQNSYLVSKLGSLIPAYRGVVGLIFRQAYLGNNPYLKPWSARGTRVHVRQDGIEQWYDEKAGIGTTNPAPVDGQPWFDSGTNFFTIGAGSETSGTQTEFQSWFPGYIDSLRVTKGVARYPAKKFAVPTEEFPNGPTDGYWDSVITLLRFDGANGATASTCEKGNAVAHNGGASLSTAIKKFGLSSCHFDGVNDWVKVTVGTEGQDLGETFTIEAWVYPTGRVNIGPITGSYIYGAPILAAGPISTSGMDTYFSVLGENAMFHMQSAYPDFDTYLHLVGQLKSVPLNEWTHISVCRDGASGLYWVHVNGELATYSTDGSDLNAAHIIRECLTDPDWGMGYTDGDVDDVSFMSAADTFADEGLGLSLLWDKTTKIEDFVQLVQSHVDVALYVSRTTGKYVLKPIRGDYDEGALISLDESNIISIDNPTRIASGELTNSVTVTYWDASTGKDASVTVTDTAMVQQQGVIINAPLQYPGFSNARNATIAAQRDLRVLSSALLSCTITANSDAKPLNIGDVFKFSWAKWGLVDVVMRVNGISYGTGRNNRVKINCTQDVFDTNTTVVISVPDGDWLDPSSPPSPVLAQLAVEAPYWELVQGLGQSDTDNKLLTHPEIGYVIAAGGRAPSAINASLHTDSGSGYADVGALDFSPFGYLAADIGKLDTALTLDGGNDLSEVIVGTHVQIGDELMRVDTIDADTGELTVGRGVLDTVPAEHTAGELAMFWDVYAAFDPTEYVATEEVDAKIVPVSGSGVLPIEAAVAMTVTMDSRAARPYAPGDLRINGDSYVEGVTYEGEVEVSWTDRDRLQQTSGTLIDHTAGNIGPEAGTEYRLRVYIDDVLDQTIEPAVSPQAVTPGGSGTVRVDVYSKRDGLYSWQGPSHSFLSANFRVTEEGDNRITEDAEDMATE
jgi:hypothetical protein